MLLTARTREPVDSASIGVFRAAFGLILLIEVVRYFLNGWIDSVYMTPMFHFTFVGFGWVRPWPDIGMYIHFGAIGLAAAFLAIGFRPRTTSAFLALAMTYIVLIEKAVYLNHFYFVCTLLCVLAFVPSDRAFAWRPKSAQKPIHRVTEVPAAALWALRAQVAIPYVYGGIAKLNGDWLRGQPMQIWMEKMTHVREFIPFFGEHWLAIVFSYGGFLLDLLVVPFLLWSRTRSVAFCFALGFHFCNSIFFQIGIFPWLMIVATSLFLPPSWPRRFLRSTTDNRVTSAAVTSHSPRMRPGFSWTFISAASIWLGVQLTVPFRHLLYPGPVDWTEEGTHFSWRMMLNDKSAAMRLLVIDAETQKTLGVINPHEYLTPVQYTKMSYDPDMLIEFCQFSAKHLRRSHGRPIEIRAHVLCSLNGRHPQLLVDPEVDLSSLRRGIWHQPCIVPLKETFPNKPWVSSSEAWAKAEKSLRDGLSSRQN